MQGTPRVTLFDLASMEHGSWTTREIEGEKIPMSFEQAKQFDQQQAAAQPQPIPGV